MRVQYFAVHLFGSEGRDINGEIRVKDGETLDSALRRFKRQCQRSGIRPSFAKENARKAECKEKEKV